MRRWCLRWAPALYLALLGCFVSAENATVYFYETPGSWELKMGVVDPKNGVAWGEFFDDIESDGWGKLYIASNAEKDDYMQAYAAGIVEGALSQKRIYEQYVNIYSYFWGNTSNPLPEELQQWMKSQDSWGRAESAKRGDDHYWAQMQSVYAQLDGLSFGYSLTAPSAQKLKPLAFQILNGVGDLLDLTGIFKHSETLGPVLHQWDWWKHNSHCSALIKLTGNLSDVFAGHTSWFVYASMLRIAKSYDLPFKNPTTQSRQVIFSSYPGFLVSLDDYYITSSNLVVIETSIGVYSETLKHHVATHPAVLLSWQRTLLANRMSGDGPEWAEVYKRHNSGTYNNQWMVLDVKRFNRGVGLDENTLTILEQIPTLVEHADETNILEKGYWASYNVPFFKNIFQLSGTADHVHDNPIMLSYQTCCRANIFRRDQGTVDSLESFKHIMRYNDWQHDPYSFDNPGYSISSRFDLEPKNAGAFGGYDSKAANYDMILNMQFQAINGPTYQEQPVFEWTSKFDSVVHLGQPKRFDFQFILFSNTSAERANVVDELP